MDNKSKSVLKNILIFILLVVLLLVPGYFFYKIFFLDKNDIQEDTPISQEETKDEIEQQESVEKESIPFKEYFPILDQQQAYVVVPGKLDKENPPILIIYSHGSNTTVTQNMQDQFMQDLLAYGEYFSNHNYIFSASNQHGANWGSAASLRDTSNLIEWVMENFDIKAKIYMIGFSMGGLPTMNFVSQNSNMIEKVALLAPTTKASEWNIQRAEMISNIKIKIWHGNADVNVPYSSTVNFVNKLKNLGKEIQFETIQGKGHWDLDTEYMEEILIFFNE